MADRLFVVKLPTRIAPNNGSQMNAAQVLTQVVLTLPFWRAGRDLARLDTQASLEEKLEDSSTLELRLTEQQREHLAQAMEAPQALLQGPINRLYSETMRAVLAAEREP